MIIFLTRVCPRCEETKGAEDFYLRKNVAGEMVPGGYCKPCAHEVRRLAAQANPEREKAYRRKQHLKAAYDLTEEEFLHQLWEVQLGLCALGAEEIDETTAHVDHDHETGKLRGLLCGQCNWALGKLGDNEDGLIWALEYVRGGSDV